MIKKVKFNKKAKQKIVTFTINEKIHPFDRDERYESNIEKFLSKNKYGEIVNIGTLQFANGEIEFFDISILIYNNFDFKKVINELIYKFEELGAPKGSYLTIEETNIDINFGQKEGLGIYLDGINLPPNVYRDCDINYVIEKIRQLIKDEDEILRYWEGNEVTALYFYGDSFERMKNNILNFINTYPLCQNTKLIQIA